MKQKMTIRQWTRSALQEELRKKWLFWGAVRPPAALEVAQALWDDITLPDNAAGATNAGRPADIMAKC